MNIWQKMSHKIHNLKDQIKALQLQIVCFMNIWLLIKMRRMHMSFIPIIRTAQVQHMQLRIALSDVNTFRLMKLEFIQEK